MRKLLVPAILAVTLIFAVCSKNDDDGGTTPVEPPPEPARVVVDTLAAAPTLSSVNEATWSNVDSFMVRIGHDANTYGKNNSLGEQDLVMKAILNSDTLYLWLRWHDPSGADTLANRFKKMALPNIWDYLNLIGQDMLFIIFDAQDNGTEMADCATMCHADGMKTTGGGHADVWKWMATASVPARMAIDKWLSGTGSAADATINDYAIRDNNNYGVPQWMHEDSVEIEVPVLYWDKAVTFKNDALLSDTTWPENYIMPGYVIDSTLFYLDTSRSLNDVRSIAEYNPTAHDWTVVFARPLNSGHIYDDVNMAGMDSIQLSLAATSNHPDSVIAPQTKPAHSGSEPFWMILKP